MTDPTPRHPEPAAVCARCGHAHGVHLTDGHCTYYDFDPDGWSRPTGRRCPCAQNLPHDSPYLPAAPASALSPEERERLTIWKWIYRLTGDGWDVPTARRLAFQRWLYQLGRLVG